MIRPRVVITGELRRCGCYANDLAGHEHLAFICLLGYLLIAAPALPTCPFAYLYTNYLLAYLIIDLPYPFTYIPSIPIFVNYLHVNISLPACSPTDLTYLATDLPTYISASSLAYLASSLPNYLLTYTFTLQYIYRHTNLP